MANDDDRTPREGKRRHQTQTERDLDGIKARAERARRGHHDQIDELAAAADPDDAVPDTWDDVDTGVTATEQLERTIEGDPALRVMYAKIVHERKRRGSDIMAALGKKPPAERMSAFERTLRRLRWVVIAIAIPAGSSTIIVAKYLMARSAAEERSKIETEQLQAHDADYERRIRQLEDMTSKNAQRIDDFIRSRRHDPDSDTAPRRDPPPTRGTP